MSAALLDKLREKYKRAAEQHGERVFNIKELESRITHLLTTRGNLELFLKAEMEFYEKALNIVKVKNEEIKRKEEANAKIDAILEKNLEKIKKYRESYFDPIASVEVRKMVGAISDWYEEASELIKHMFRGSECWKELTSIQTEIERFYIPNGRPATVYLNQFIMELKKMAVDQKENTERRLIQTIANSLYKMENTLKKELESMTDFQKSRFVTMSPAFDPKVREKWARNKEGEALGQIISGISGIIDDFRLRDLSALGFKSGS